MREKSKSEWPTWISTPCEESVQSTSISFTLSFLGENKKISISHPGQHTPPLNTYSYTFDPTPDIPLYMAAPPQLRANKRNDTEVYVCVQQAASSYNNIALWRSPERTGKCCLCVSTRGLVGGWPLDVELFAQPQQQTTWGGRGRLRKARRGRRRGSKRPLYTCQFHLWGEQGVKACLSEDKCSRKSSEGVWAYHMNNWRLNQS